MGLAIIALIIGGIYLFFTAVLFVFKAIILGILIFIAQKKFKKVHPTVFILISAIVGIMFNFAA